MITDFGGSKPVFIQNNTITPTHAVLNSLTYENFNASCIYDFVLFSSFCPPQGPVIGTQLVGPGHTTMEYCDYKNLNIEPYTGSETKIVQSIEAALQQSVNRMLDDGVSGLMLSGGIDSAILLSMMPASEITCVTWGGWGSKSSDIVYGKKNVEHFKPKKHIEVFGSQSDLALYVEIIQKLGFPALLPAAIPYARMSQEFTKHSIHSIGMGQNADTLSMSYNTPILTLKINAIQTLIPVNIFGWHSRYSRYFAQSARSLISLIGTFKSGNLYPEFLKIPTDYWHEKEVYLKQSLPEGKMTKQQHIILIEELLSEGRKSQIYQHGIPNTFGINQHTPYYDQQVIESFLRIPVNLIKKEKYSKYILRSIAQKRGVPIDVINKGKKGLSYNIEQCVTKECSAAHWQLFINDTFLNEYINMPELHKKFGKNQDTYCVVLALWVWKSLFLDKQSTSQIIDVLHHTNQV